MRKRADLCSRTGRRRRSYCQIPHAVLVNLPVGAVPAVCRHAHTPPRPRTAMMRKTMAAAFVLAFLPLAGFKDTLKAAILPEQPKAMMAARPAAPPRTPIGGVMLSFARSLR